MTTDPKLEFLNPQLRWEFLEGELRSPSKLPMREFTSRRQLKKEGAFERSEKLLVAANVALSPIGYWPRGVRPSWKKASARSARRFWLLPFILVFGFSLAGCSQLASNRQVMKTTLNTLMNASFAFLTNEAAVAGKYFANNVQYWRHA